MFLLNSVINVLALRTVGASWRVAVLAGFALAQIGEFAFVLAAAGVASGLIGEEAQRMVVAVIALTMVISPMWLALARRLHGLPAARPSGCRGCGRGSCARRRASCGAARSSLLHDSAALRRAARRPGRARGVRHRRARRSAAMSAPPAPWTRRRPAAPRG